MVAGKKLADSDRVKVIYFIGTLDRGGAEGQLLKLLEGLDRERFSPSLVVMKGKGDYYPQFEKLGIPMYLLEFAGTAGTFLPWNLVRVLKNLYSLLRVMKKEAHHVVHGYLFVSYACAAVMGKLAGAPVIVTSRRSLGSSKTRMWTPFHRLIEKTVNCWTDCIIANSQAVKNDTVEREKLEPSRIMVIHNGVDLQRFTIEGQALRLREEFHIRSDARVVGIIANLIHYKNHRMLISAIPLVKKRIPEAHFLLIGRDGGMEASLKEYARSRGVAEDITFAGPRQDIPELLSLMEVSALTSLEEGFPNAVLESMAAGVPVVATSVGGVPELVVDGVTGFLVDSGDHLALAEKTAELLSDGARAKEMGAQGKKRMEECFSLEKMVRATENAYVELLKRKRKNVDSTDNSGGSGL